MSDRVKKNIKLALIFTIYTVLIVTLDGSIIKMLFNYILKLFSIGVTIGIFINIASYISEKVRVNFDIVFPILLLIIVLLIFIYKKMFLILIFGLLGSIALALFVSVFIGLGILAVCFILELIRNGDNI